MTAGRSFAELTADLHQACFASLGEAAVYCPKNGCEISTRAAVDFEQDPIPEAGPGIDRRNVISLAEVDVPRAVAGDRIKVSGQLYVVDSVKERDRGRLQVYARKVPCG